MFPSKTKSINVRVFNMIIRKNKSKTFVKHVSYNCKSKSIVQLAIQVKNEIIKHANVSIKVMIRARRITVGNPLHVFVRIVSI